MSCCGGEAIPTPDEINHLVRFACPYGSCGATRQFSLQSYSFTEEWQARRISQLRIMHVCGGSGGLTVPDQWYAPLHGSGFGGSMRSTFAEGVSSAAG